MEVKEYPHWFFTWEGYPRVHYFQSRYIDLHTRFKKLMKALPERFHSHSQMDQFEELSSCLANFLQVTVIGEHDIYPGNLVVSDKALEKHPVLPDFSHKQRIHICICYAKVGSLDEAGLQDVSTVVDYLSKGCLERCPGLRFVLFVCETKSEVSQNDADMFRSQLQQVLEKTSNRELFFDILVGPKGNSLPTSISNVLEKKIINGFHEIFTFLQRFMRKDIRYDQESMNILESETVTSEIRGFLQNGLALVDAKRLRVDVSLKELILQLLCSKILCATVAPLATKHNLPDWVCHGLLEELKFDKTLQESISRNTLHHLKKFEEYVNKLVAESETGGKTFEQTQGTCHSFDFILYQLQKDMTAAVTSVEIKLSAMNRITVVIRKMLFEIRGYLYQTTLTVEITEIGQRELTSEDITDELQENIMRTAGVYGMGTLFGQLEIHLKKDMQEEDVKDARDALAETLKKFQFHHPYIVRAVENHPKPLARTFYEQGDRIFSTFPNDETQCREGTVGCFVKGNDGSLYALTCAHVVDPHNKDEHDVYIIKHATSRLFAVSKPRMLFYGTRVENDLFLADFAAIEVVLQAVKDMCSFHLKDEFGNNKPARIVSESSGELVGSYVYKYGARTGLTKGIIASDKYILCGEDSNNHVLIIEPLPETSENICGVFTSEGGCDSSSSSQTSNMSAENGQECMNEPAITDLLADKNDEPLLNESSMNTQNNQSVQECSYCDSINSNEASAACMKFKSLQPRPETLNECETRDSETYLMTNANELQSSPLSENDASVLTVWPFADQGDSGSIVCKRDISNDEIVAISMVTAGDFSFKDSVPESVTESDRRKCVSVRLDQALAKLSGKCGKHFSIS